MGELKRNCPKCGREIIYTNKYNLKYAKINNSKCRFCQILGIKYAKPVNPDDLKRKCPNCGKEIVYSRKDGAVRANKGNKVCISCSTTKENNPFYGKHHSEISIFNNRVKHVGKSHSEKTKYKLRLLTLNYLKKLNIKGGRNYNPKACDFIDILNKKLNINLLHAKNNKEGEIQLNGYFVDGYDREKNIIFEYDEKRGHHHGKEKEKDLIRQNNLLKSVKPSQFIRYDERNNKLYDVVINVDISNVI